MVITLQLSLSFIILALITKSEETELWLKSMRPRCASESTTAAIQLKVFVFVLFSLPLFFSLYLYCSVYFLMRCLVGGDD